MSNPNFKVASLDGYGDDDSMALARDKQQQIIKQNSTNHFYRCIPVSQYASSDHEKALSAIVKEMISEGQARRLYPKEQIFLDVQDIHEAVNNCCIELGLTDEDYCPELIDKGDEVEITL